MSVRARRKESRPAEVLDAALDAFMANGFAATRMDDIAARAGVAKGTLYLYYPSKQAIFEALVRTHLLPRLARAEALLAGGDGADAVLRRLLDLVGTVLAEPRLAAIPRLVLAEAGRFPDLARFYRREVVGRGLGVLEALIARGVGEGRFRPVDAALAARLFMAPAILAALWQGAFAPIEEAPVPPAALLRLHADLFLRGLAVETTP